MKHKIYESLDKIGLSREALCMALDLPLTDLEAWMGRYAATGKLGIRDDVATVFEYIEQKAESAEDALLYARTMHSASEDDNREEVDIATTPNVPNEDTGFTLPGFQAREGLYGRTAHSASRDDDREKVDIATVPDVSDEDMGFTFFQDSERTNVRVVAPIPKGWMIINLHGHLASLTERAPYLRWSVKFCLRTPELDTAENVMLINRWHTTEKFEIDNFDTVNRWADCCSTFFGNLGLMPFIGKAMIQSVGISALAKILKFFGGNDEV